ncbi:hypothetical protein A249_16728 [Pseudomonas syringae pv. actinidiae ICMP 18804]|nr:hypothetical protein A249_16728 [Pseudomonas syringae pv. actinidiae ICMP 18804]
MDVKKRHCREYRVETVFEPLTDGLFPHSEFNYTGRPPEAPIAGNLVLSAVLG